MFIYVLIYRTHLMCKSLHKVTHSELVVAQSGLLISCISACLIPCLTFTSSTCVLSTGTVMPPERNNYFRKYMKGRRNPSGEKTAGQQSTPLADEAVEARRIRKNERNRQSYARTRGNDSPGTWLIRRVLSVRQLSLVCVSVSQVLSVRQSSPVCPSVKFCLSVS